MGSTLLSSDFQSLKIGDHRLRTNRGNCCETRLTESGQRAPEALKD